MNDCYQPTVTKAITKVLETPEMPKAKPMKKKIDIEAIALDVPGVIVYVSGKDVDKVSNIDIYFKESEDK